MKPWVQCLIENKKSWKELAEKGEQIEFSKKHHKDKNRSSIISDAESKPLEDSKKKSIFRNE